MLSRIRTSSPTIIKYSAYMASGTLGLIIGSGVTTVLTAVHDKLDRIIENTKK
jgi:hypothetical protein